MERPDEASWLRYRTMRLRIALRYVESPRVESILRELIADAEDRLIGLDAKEWAWARQSRPVDDIT